MYGSVRGAVSDGRPYRDPVLPGDGPVPLERFRQRIGWYWQHTLARRSQTGRISAERLSRLCAEYLPRPRLMHPYPDVRFDATHPR